MNIRANDTATDRETERDSKKEREYGSGRSGRRKEERERERELRNCLFGREERLGEDCLRAVFLEWRNAVSLYRIVSATSLRRALPINRAYYNFKTVSLVDGAWTPLTQRGVSFAYLGLVHT